MKSFGNNKLTIQQFNQMNGLIRWGKLVMFSSIVTATLVLVTVISRFQLIALESWRFTPIIISIGLLSIILGMFSSRKYFSNVFEALGERKHQYSLDKLREFTTTVETLTDLNQVAPSLIKMVHMTLKCQTIILLAPERHGRSTWSS